MCISMCIYRYTYDTYNVHIRPLTPKQIISTAVVAAGPMRNLAYILYTYVCVYIYIYICMYVCIYIYIYMYVLSIPFQLPYHPKVALGARLIIGLGNTNDCAPSSCMYTDD